MPFLSTLLRTGPHTQKAPVQLVPFKLGSKEPLPEEGNARHLLHSVYRKRAGNNTFVLKERVAGYGRARTWSSDLLVSPLPPSMLPPEVRRKIRGLWGNCVVPLTQKGPPVQGHRLRRQSHGLVHRSLHSPSPLPTHKDSSKEKPAM